MLLNILKSTDRHLLRHKIFIPIDQSFNTKNTITSREPRLKKIVNDMKNGIRINSKLLRRSLLSRLMMKLMEIISELWRRFWKKDSRFFLEQLMNKLSSRQSIQLFKKLTTLSRPKNLYILSKIKIRWKVAILLEVIKMTLILKNLKRSSNERNEDFWNECKE